MIKRFLIILLLCVSTSCLIAQSTGSDSILLTPQPIDAPVADEEDYEENYEEEEITDTILNIRDINISPDSILHWKNKKELAYIKNLDSLLKISQNKEAADRDVNSGLRKLSFIESILNGSILKIILWMMAIFFVLIILYQLIKNQGIFKRTFAKGVVEQEMQPQEDLLKQNFDNLINQSCSKDDYRTAIRYQFLKTLQLLSDNTHIEFAADKTNSRYVQELPKQWQQEFSKLVLNYEYIWYGNFAITKEQYSLLQAQYLIFNKKT